MARWERLIDMQLNIAWGSSLERMADDLFRRLGECRVGTAEIFAKRDCIVVPNRIQQAWLQHHFLFDMPRGATPHVLANCDFPPFNLFINDWLNRISPAEQPGRPDPEKHPFSVKSTRWRIFNFLLNGDLSGDFAPLLQYVQSRGSGSRDSRKCFKLAGRLAALFDQYVTYRPAMMLEWSKSTPASLPPELHWEPALWRQITSGAQNYTYLDLYQRMIEHLGECSIENQYRRIFVFNPSLMPPVHLAFFKLLGDILPVHLYLFNPAPAHDWFDRESLRQRIQDAARTDALFDLPGDPDDLLNLKHPLLDAYGRGARDMAGITLDFGDGQIVETATPAYSNSLLHTLQQSIIECDASMDTPPLPPDGSIQIHKCHGKMREVEILRDQLLDCFNNDPTLQPRHIQVQVPDLNDYAPYIEAVFSTPNRDARDTIPFVIADSVSTGESQAAEAFRQLLALSDSRFTAPEILDLLRYPGIARRFHFSPGDVDNAAAWIQKAGIRWGRNRHHRREVVADFTEDTTWQVGFDRLFLGYALGSKDDHFPEFQISPSDTVEGGDAILLGHLARFYNALTDFAKFSSSEHSLAEWADRLDLALNDFFLSDNETYLHIAVLRKAVGLLRTTAAASGFIGKVPIAIIRDFLAGHFNETEGGSELHRNAVVFSSLRPGSTAPRRVQALLGMGDSLFPRVNDRPAYDLLRDTRKMGDRSSTIEDRQAFLEVILNAREKLLIFYPAFSEEDNTASIESVAVRELAEYINRRFQSKEGPSPLQTFTHRLQAHNPAYFTASSPLFSYSSTAGKTAQAILQPPAPAPAAAAAPAAAPAPSSPTIHVGLHELISFFKNPAEYYFTKILKASLSTGDDIMLEDTEPFASDTLQNWQVRKRLIDSLAAGEDDSARQRILAELTANGNAPFGPAGQKWFAELRDEAEALINQSPGNHLPILKDILVAQKSLTRTEFRVSIPVRDIQVELSGFDRLHPACGIVHFQPSSAQPHKHIGTWLTHLLVNADPSSSRPCSCSVMRKKAELDPLHFAPFKSPADAQNILAAYLEIFLYQSAPPPRYTPDTAWAFVEQFHGKGKTQDVSLREAKGKWENPYGGSSFQGEANPYYLQLYGADGPFEPFDKFRSAAEKIILPMWRHLNPEDPA